MNAFCHMQVQCTCVISFYIYSFEEVPKEEEEKKIYKKPKKK